MPLSQYTKTPTISRQLSSYACHRGENILDLTYQLPVLFVFLRQMGCIFCRQTLQDLADHRVEIEMEGAAIALVHMSAPDEADTTLNNYGLDNVVRISDPFQKLYQTFFLPRAGKFKILGPHIWYKTAVTRMKHKILWGRVDGDPFQMPGAFLVYQGRIINSYRHKQPYDRPDYTQLATIPDEVEDRLAANRLPLD